MFTERLRHSVAFYLLGGSVGIAELFGFKDVKHLPRGGFRYLRDNAKAGRMTAGDGREYIFNGREIRRAFPKVRGKSALRLAKKQRRLTREAAAIREVTA